MMELVGALGLIPRDDMAACAPAFRQGRTIVRVCGKRSLVSAGQQHQCDAIRQQTHGYPSSALVAAFSLGAQLLISDKIIGPKSPK
jgi:hypothetical protein